MILAWLCHFKRETGGGHLKQLLFSSTLNLVSVYQGYTGISFSLIQREKQNVFFYNNLF